MRSIQYRLNLIYGILIAISFIFLGIAILIPLESTFIKQAEENLAPQARMATLIIKPYLLSKDDKGLQSVIKEVGEENNIRLTIVDKNGLVLADSEHDYSTMDNHLNRPEIRDALQSGLGHSARLSDTLHENMLYSAYWDKSTNTVMRVAVSLWRIDELFKRVRNIILSVLTATGLLVLYASFRTAKSITTPISYLKASAQKIAQGDFEARAEIDTRDELAELSDALNSMAEKLKLYVKNINIEREQLKVIFEQLSAGVVVLNPSGQIILINSTAEKLFNVSRTQLEDQLLHRILRDERFESIFKEALQQNLAKEYALRYREFFLNLHFVPLTDTSGNKKVVILIYDTTAIKHWQQMRSDFVANASHELRTPLTAIKGYTETLLDGALEDEIIARDFLIIIERESERLTRIVEDLLDLSRLERKTDLSKENFVLHPFVEKVAKNFYTVFQDKQLVYINNIPQSITVSADNDWLEQVFVNLIDNAVKYSKIGGNISIEAEDLKDYVQVKVIDTGIGIPYEDMPRIFERFYRVDKSRSRSLGGTGLGLAIVKHIIESHGGEVFAESALGEGTTIGFTLPKEI